MCGDFSDILAFKSEYQGDQQYKGTMFVTNFAVYFFGENNEGNIKVCLLKSNSLTKIRRSLISHISQKLKRNLSLKQELLF